ncbi:MAG: hypothetical protein ACYC27_20970 [Armatimonadota bacterium]
MKRPFLTSFIIALTLIISSIFYNSRYQMPWDKTIRLPQGYYLGNIDTDPILLTGPSSSGKAHLGPAVDGYLVLPRIIIGHISSGKDASGYFIVDMVTGKIDDGLSKQAWIDKLREYEVTGDVKLWKPSRRDEKLGRNRFQVPWGQESAE